MSQQQTNMALQSGRRSRAAAEFWTPIRWIGLLIDDLLVGIKEYGTAGTTVPLYLLAFSLLSGDRRPAIVAPGFVFLQ
eukprot:SAG25_NODE_6729_length_534_cov_1.800000_2_plen_77_part_01